jgi:hypothetical protein
MATEPFQTTLVVKHASGDYEFRIPDLYDEIRLGAREEAIHKKIDPAWNGTQSLSYTAQAALEAAACFDVLLNKASDPWPFEQTPSGPVVNSEKFPRDKVVTTIEVWQGFMQALRTFRQGGDSNGQAAAQEAVASQQNPQ